MTLLGNTQLLKNFVLFGKLALVEGTNRPCRLSHLCNINIGSQVGTARSIVVFYLTLDYQRTHYSTAIKCTQVHVIRIVVDIIGYIIRTQNRLQSSATDFGQPIPNLRRFSPNNVGDE